MEQKRLSYARSPWAPGCAKSLCRNKSRVILRKFHFMYFLRHILIPIKYRNQIRT